MKPPTWTPDDLAGLEEDGQLSVDVIERPDVIIVRSTIAGVSVEDLDISVTTDTLTIRGSREVCEASRPTDIIHVIECHWGAFSRSIVLPHPVYPDEADAVLQNGILTVTLKKSEGSKTLRIEDDSEYL